MSESDIYDEIEQEIRRDDALKLWSKYQWPVYALAVLVLIGLGAWRYWEFRSLQAAQAQGDAYVAALQLGSDGKPDEALKALQALGREQGGYALLARMSAADEMVDKDPAAAAKAYDDLAADQSLPQLFRNVARLRAAFLHVDDKDPKEAIQRLQELATPAFPFHTSALEQLAVLALAAKDYTEAGRRLDMIVADPQAPSALRQRAEALEGLVSGAAPFQRPSAAGAPPAAAFSPPSAGAAPLAPPPSSASGAPPAPTAAAPAGQTPALSSAQTPSPAPAAGLKP